MNDYLMIVCALECEARSLINSWSLTLERDFDILSRRLRIYRGRLHSQPILLIISGAGASKASTATAALIGYSARQDTFKSFQISWILNIGIAGDARKSPAEPGSLWMINRVTDSYTNRNFYPEIFWRHNLPESHLTTVARPTSTTTELLNCLIDMEASGILAAGGQFLGPERMMTLKIVSDRVAFKSDQEACLGSRPKVSPTQVQNWLSDHVAVLESTIQAWIKSSPKITPVLDSLELKLIDSVSSSCRLTTTQRQILITSCKSFKLQEGQLTERLKKIIAQGHSLRPSSSSPSRAKGFARLLEEFR